MPLQQYYVEKVIKHKAELLPDGYKHFGTDSNVANLELLLQNNPFFASVLSKGAGFNAYSAVTYSKSPPKSFFGKIISYLDDSYPRVNAQFNSKLQLTSVESFDGAGNRIKKSQEEAAGDLLFLILFHSECIHALIHIFHYINTLSMYEASKVNPMLELWAKPYLANIGIKYEEVEAILLGEQRALTGGGFRSDGDKVRELLRETLAQWGSFKTADEFIDKFLLQSTPKGSLKKDGHLAEFYKHASLINPFSKELAAAFKAYDPAKYGAAEEKLIQFLSETGNGVSSISDFPTWVNLMSVTGIMHGSTLSFSRVVMTEEMLKRASPTDTYSALEEGLATLVAGTTVGMIEDRHVFSAALQQETLKSTLKGVKLMDPIAKQVLIKYDALSSKYKLDLFNKLKADPVTFREKGWVLTDHCPDGVDGKQLTLTTYI